MVNSATAIGICELAKNYYNSLFVLKGLSYYMPFLRKANIHSLTGSTLIIQDDQDMAPEDIEVSCETDNILRMSGLDIGTGRLLRMRKLAFGFEYPDCVYDCLGALLTGANNLSYAQMQSIFNLNAANKIRFQLGYKYDSIVQSLMYEAVPDGDGHSISAADDGIVTVKFDDIKSFEPQLRDTFTRYLFSNTYNAVGDVIIYGDSDLQALMSNGLVMGQNAFGACCKSEFATNIRFCSGSTGMDTFVYSVPATVNKSLKFFKEDATYRYYFAIASGRLDFGFDAAFPQRKMLGCHGVENVLIPAEFMERYIGCEYIQLYQEILENINGQAHLYMKNVMNPAHNELITSQVSVGSRANITRRAHSGVILAVKKELFTKFITSTTLSEGTFTLGTATVDTPSGDPVEYSKPAKNKH